MEQPLKRVGSMWLIDHTAAPIFGSLQRGFPYLHFSGTDYKGAMVHSLFQENANGTAT